MSEYVSMPDHTRCMVDIETLGRKPGCVILSIGAVRFNANSTNSLGMHTNVSIDSCVDYGLEIEPETLEWWLSQDDEVQDVLTGGQGLASALGNLSDFYDGCNEIWAKSPKFDCGILEAAYDAVGVVDVPWEYDETRCVRTIGELDGMTNRPPNDFEAGPDHNALEDAKWQAAVVRENLQRMDR